MGRKPDLDTLDVRQLAQELLGTGEVTISAVRTEGMETHAYRIANPQRASCLRIGRSTRGFAKDRWAHELLGHKLPIPLVQELGQLDQDRAFCLSEWVPGATVQDLTATDVRQVLPAALDAWATIAGSDITTISGCGDLDPETRNAPYRTWHEVLRAPAEKARSWDQAWTTSRARQLDHLLHTYSTLIDRCPDERRLIHGDWGANNLLADHGHVTGLLDWEAAAIGDPLQDVGGRFWATWPPVTTWVTLQADYCDERLGHLPHYHDRVLCYDLYGGLHEIDSALDDGDHSWADWAFRRCLELIGHAP